MISRFGENNFEKKSFFKVYENGWKVGSGLHRIKKRRKWSSLIDRQTSLWREHEFPMVSISEIEENQETGDKTRLGNLESMW